MSLTSQLRVTRSSLASTRDVTLELHCMPGDIVHQGCRCKYCNPHQIANDTHQEEPMPSTSSNGRPVIRSSEEGFSFKTDCFFCGRTAKLGRKRKYDVFEVKTIGIKETTVMQSSDDLELAFKHQLCSYPPALFDSSLLLHEADKPALADAIWKICESGSPADIPDDHIQYVLDGGALIQCIPWSRGSTYGDICHQYTEYVVRRYKDAIVVFDGYENMNTKDVHDTSETVKRKDWCNRDSGC